ncbi:ribose transport system substrate-binding protein [Rhizobium sp. BK313]|uniref:substrate-binding domain-containing protein n=1 Tax=Rhizobium sp. BK313 TaxID=2587081 RepID=UPI0010600756|nr:substrate-binding domain-containing protein [Rhizobium sp. BK313]MBB3459316.1 ribose transport system substrate-binding protein [Rhizobium sp. BK313]
MGNKLLTIGTGLALGISIGSLPAHADDYVDKAKAYIASITKPGGEWTGPTSGPKVQGKKTIVFVNYDQRNSGGRAVGEFAGEAAKIVGWDYRVLDGQGTVSGQTAALNQAIALKPDGIILGSVDALEHNPEITEAVKQGIKVVSWHSGTTPGTIQGSPIFTNVTTDPTEVATAAGLYAVADSNGTAKVVLFTDSAYQICITKTNAEKAAIEGCKNCKVLDVEDTPLGEASTRMPQLTTTLMAKYGENWTHSIGINDLYFDYMAPALQAAGIDGAGKPRNISAGDGSESAFQRIDTNQFQMGTVAEPLRLHGFQLIDELNRAFSGEKASGYSAPVHLFTPENVKSDRGPGGIYDPANNYEQHYKTIWGLS